jgi:predicted MFS family arabinose efflux permease
MASSERTRAAPSRAVSLPREADVRLGPEPPPISRRLVGLLALTTGASVANMYYVQPLLHVIGRAFSVSNGLAGLLVTFTQVGYVAGLILLVPLGDLLERRRLITTVLAGAAVAAILCCAAPSFAILAAALLVLGTTSASAQIIIPMTSSLAAPRERGQVVGTVMSGLLLGVLLARTVSGLIASVAGWRVMFAVGAGMMLVLSLIGRRALPRVEPTEPVRYPTALRSVLTLIREEPVLRQRMALGSCGFACFSVLWTSITFLLSRSPYGYSSAVIGLFGLAGAAGALMAPIAGRFVDRGHARVAQTVLISLMAAAWILLALGASSIVALVAGIIVLDLGIQGAQIGNQHAIYRLRPEARSRINTGYMVAVFLGGVVGSILSTTIYNAAGWHAVCALGGAIGVLAVVIWLTTRRLVSHPAARHTGRTDPR